MHVHDLLTAFLSDIEFQSVSRNIHPMGQVTGKEKKPADSIPIGILHIGNGSDVTFRDQEHMDPGFWVDIVKHDIIFILINRNGRDFTSDDGTEKAHTNTVKG